MTMPPFEDMRDINLAKLRRLDEEVGVDLEDVAEMLTERDYRIAELDAEVRRLRERVNEYRRATETGP